MKGHTRHLISIATLVVLLLLASNPLPSLGIGNSAASRRDELILFDSFFNSEPARTRRERLSLLVKAMSSRPDDTAYIVAYGNLARIDCAGVDSLKFVRDHLRRESKLNRERVVYINGGYLTKGMTEIYLLPPDVKFPIPRLDFNELLK